jgi:enoyl-CoA hydratase/carnithine racemase
MRAESEQFSARLRSPELREAVKAFTEKRAPDFSKAG